MAMQESFKIMSKASKYIEPTQINDILKAASILKKEIEEAPYQKKRKIHY